MLTGNDLIAKAKELDGASKTELVRACGYTSTKEDGSERMNYTAFYDALLEAKGVSLKPMRGKGSRRLSYTARVQGNGNLLVGKAYTVLMDLEPGTEFEIKLGRTGIFLKPKEATVNQPAPEEALAMA